MTPFYVTKITQEPGFEDENHVTVELSTHRTKPLLNIAGGANLTIGPMLESQAGPYRIGAVFEVEIREAVEALAIGGGSGD